MTMKNPTGEIREIRHQLAAKFDNDLNRIVEDLMRQQRESGRKYVSLPRRAPKGMSLPIPPTSGGQAPDQSLPNVPPAR
jgi:hypothetical protein